MDRTKFLNEIQDLSQEEIAERIALMSLAVSDPRRANQTVNIETKITRSKDMSKYRPKQLMVLGLDHGSVLDIQAGTQVTTAYTLLKELHKNRDHYSNFSYIDKAGKDLSNLNKNLKSWIQADLIVPVKTQDQIDSIYVAAKATGLSIDIPSNKNHKVFMFNPSLLLPYSRMDKGKHFDTIYLIYQYLKSYVPPTKSAYQDCHKKHKDAMVKEYFKDSNQCSFDEFLDRSKEYINLCLAGKEPILEGWFKLPEEQSKDKSI